MTNVFNLPSVEDCTIHLVYEGNDIPCDIYEIHELMMEARTEAEQLNVSYGDLFINKMFERYNVKLTYSASKLLILKVRELMVDIKKKCTPLPDLGIPTDSTGSV